jgi:hypothetical protein
MFDELAQRNQAVFRAYLQEHAEVRAALDAAWRCGLPTFRGEFDRSWAIALFLAPDDPTLTATRH